MPRSEGEGSARTEAARVSSGPRVQPRCFEDAAALTAALAERLDRALCGASASPSASMGQDSDAVASSPFAIMLSGGNTPLPAYRAVAARHPRPPPGLTLFYSDDRYVPSSSEASNYHQTQPLLDALALPPERVLRVRTELPLQAAAEDYDRSLTELARRSARFTLGLLGLGADGHTASLFGARDIERAQGHRAIAVHRPDGRDGVSVTPQVLASLRELVFVVAGTEKRTAVAALLARTATLTAWEAVRGCPLVEIWTDRAAWPPEVPLPG
jgi:6-phosphogluconolactonase